MTRKKTKTKTTRTKTATLDDIEVMLDELLRLTVKDAGRTTARFGDLGARLARLERRVKALETHVRRKA